MSWNFFGANKVSLHIIAFIMTDIDFTFPEVFRKSQLIENIYALLLCEIFFVINSDGNNFGNAILNSMSVALSVIFYKNVVRKCTNLNRLDTLMGNSGQDKNYNRYQ